MTSCPENNSLTVSRRARIDVEPQRTVNGTDAGGSLRPRWPAAIDTCVVGTPDEIAGENVNLKNRPKNRAGGPPSTPARGVRFRDPASR